MYNTTDAYSLLMSSLVTCFKKPPRPAHTVFSMSTAACQNLMTEF